MSPRKYLSKTKQRLLIILKCNEDVTIQKALKLMNERGCSIGYGQMQNHLRQLYNKGYATRGYQREPTKHQKLLCYNISDNGLEAIKLLEESLQFHSI